MIEFVLWIHPTDLEMEQRAEIERLRAECFSLAAHQCHAPGYGDESGNHRCKYQDDIEDLRAENAKLRETLTWIIKQEPATQDYTLISDVCERARSVLKDTQP